jgi:hypothetical protein
MLRGPILPSPLPPPPRKSPFIVKLSCSGEKSIPGNDTIISFCVGANDRSAANKVGKVNPLYRNGRLGEFKSCAVGYHPGDTGFRKGIIFYVASIKA